MDVDTLLIAALQPVSAGTWASTSTTALIAPPPKRRGAIRRR